MFIYGKGSANAIAIMSLLAADPGTRHGSTDISAARNISRPLTAKLLTQLATAGLVSGQPGPGGGYTLAREASAISLYDIVRVFEQIEGPSPCPFGPSWCGHGDPCPLHGKILAIREQNENFLRLTNLAVFVGVHPKSSV